MPDQTQVFNLFTENIPTTAEEVEAQTKQLKELLDSLEPDLDQALNEFENLGEQADDGELTSFFGDVDNDLAAQVIENLEVRGELIICLMAFEVLHKAREFCGVHKHPYTISPNQIIKALVNGSNAED